MPDAAGQAHPERPALVAIQERRTCSVRAVLAACPVAPADTVVAVGPRGAAGLAAPADRIAAAVLHVAASRVGLAGRGVAAVRRVAVYLVAAGNPAAAVPGGSVRPAPAVDRGGHRVAAAVRDDLADQAAIVRA